MSYEYIRAFTPYEQRLARAPRVQCPCVWDWIAKMKTVVGLLVSLIVLILLAHELFLLVII
ncbi:hypothetical protein [Natronorubrum sp. A-ect3]|uniref:hypothetical protein n=1 Tax=Natronorubrum sp. A-ect3 TaxID=3242698 RepID=UPI00359D1981